MRWPPLALPIQPPYPPMEAKLVRALPAGGGWQFEPKWDGFRCLAFRDGDAVALQSKAGQPLGRYFPEIVAAVRALKADRFVLDGELVVPAADRLSFEALLQRIHPAERRIRKLAAETPALYLVFDLLVENGRDLSRQPLALRRAALERFPVAGRVERSAATGDRATAEAWYERLHASGLDGIVAKRTDVPYASGERTAMQKVKRARTADCVVGGFRYAARSREVGSLLLGLYDEDGLLHHVGHCAGLKGVDKRALTAQLESMRGPGFTGAAPGGPSRWATERSGEWEAVEPRLVVEVAYTHLSERRFRHGTRFLRWRPDKRPDQCTFAQLEGGGGPPVEHAPERA